MEPGEKNAEFQTKDGRRCVLRDLKRSDLDSLVSFANTLVRERKTNEELGIISLDKRVTRKEEKRWLSDLIEGVRRKEVVSLAAVMDGKIIGHCDIHRRSQSDVHHTGVLGITIQDGYRGVGIGGKMIHEALVEAEKIGLELVELQVFATNEVAIRLYEKTGFKKVGVVPDKMLRAGRYYDEIVMYTDLRRTDKSLSAARGES